MTKDKMRDVSAAIDAALKTLTLDGVTLRIGRGTYDPAAGVGTLKIEVSTISADGIVATREAAAFRQCATLYGLQPSDLGREFTVRGVTYRIDGLKSRGSKPILITRKSDGARLVITALSVKNALYPFGLPADQKVG